MQTKVVRRLRHLITVSQASRRDIADEFGCDINTIAVIGNGVDSEVFRPQPHIARRPARLLTTTSSDQPLKGFAVLLHALKQVRERHPHAELHVIGKLNPDGANANLLMDLQLQHAVHFKSELTEAQLVEQYAQASVAVCPSLYEGFGLPAAEAMSCGVPLVSSDGGALAEVVGEGGLLVPAGESSAMATAILQVLEQPELARALSIRGRQRVERLYCWQRVAVDLVDYYRQCLSVQAAPSPALDLTSPTYAND